MGRMLDLVTILAMIAIVLIMIYNKKEIWIRRLPAIDFIEESVSRAAEMGRPVVCEGFGSTGSGLQSSMAPMILASLAVLGHAARICARHGTEIIAPMRNQSVIPVADEILKTAYRLEGKLEEYEANKESIMPWAPTQASLVAIAMRVRPATHIMIGTFWHESTQLAEIYDRVGAVQIGGTARVSQISFLAAMCDMIVIGEEVYGIGSYISQDRDMLSSLATGDYIKVVSIALILIGTVLSTMLGGINPLLALMNW